MKQPLLFACLSAALCLAACSKDDNKEPAPYEFQLKIQRNNTDITPVNIRIYKTQDDYNNAANVYFAGKTDVQTGRCQIPLDTLEKDREYFVDWYTDDYRNHNWNRDNFPVKITLRTNEKTGYYQSIGGGFEDSVRILYLNGGDKLESVWNAIGATEYGNDVWNQLPAYKKSVRITLRRNLVGELVTKDANGTEVKQSFSMNFPGSQISMAVPGTQGFIGLINAPSGYEFPGDKRDQLQFFPALGSTVYYLKK